MAHGESFLNAKHIMGEAQTFRRTTRPPASSTTMPGRRQSAQLAAQERRRAMLLRCGMLVMAGLAAAFVVTRMTAPQNAVEVSDNDLRTAKITVTSEHGGCSQQVFDNQTGRMTRFSQGCEQTPVHDGPNRRLDAISKAFSGQK